MQPRHVDLPATASQGQVEAAVAELAADPDVHGILVQLPLPAGLDPDAGDRPDPAGEGRRRPHRALDGPARARRARASSACTPLGVMRLLERYGVETSGRRAVVIGRSTARRAAAVAAAGPQGRRRHGDDGPLAHRRPGRGVPGGRHPRRRRRPGPHDHRRARQAGRRGDRRRPVAHRRRASSATSTRTASPPVAGWLTPNPGGTGPMTIACLMENTVTAAVLQGVAV